MRWHQQVQYASISDIGFRRSNNQDACVVQVCTDEDLWKRRGHLFLVADGMGGHAVGELASKIATDTIPHTFFKNQSDSLSIALRSAIEKANDTIHNRGIQNRDFLRMGTTCSTLILGPQGALIGHVGDSRVYRVRNNRIDQLTFDHSLQWEMLRQGHLKPEDVMLQEPRHVITRSLGPEERVQVDLEGPYAILPGDTYVVCSDGLTGHVGDSEIGMVAGSLDPGQACRLLVHLANLRGGSDNITVVVVRVGDVPAGIPDEPSEPSPEPVSEGPGWQTLALVWGIGLLIVFGLSLVLLKKYVSGLVFGSIGIAGALYFGVRALLRRSASVSAEGEDAETVLWRAYRTAPARCDRQFLAALAAAEAELQRSAVDEAWEIDWKTHEAAFNAGKEHLAQKRYAEALRQFAAAIDTLMVGVHQQRRQMKREVKWGRSP